MAHGNHLYSTLDGADPADPRHFCQCTSECFTAPGGSGPGTSDGANWLAVPDGWSLAPNDADSIAVTAAHGWSTFCLGLADGSGFTTAAGSPPGDSCGSGLLATSGQDYTVTGCNWRLLLRCP